LVLVLKQDYKIDCQFHDFSGDSRGQYIEEDNHVVEPCEAVILTPLADNSALYRPGHDENSAVLPPIGSYFSMLQEDSIEGNYDSNSNNNAAVLYLDSCTYTCNLSVF